MLKRPLNDRAPQPITVVFHFIHLLCTQENSQIPVCIILNQNKKLCTVWVGSAGHWFFSMASWCLLIIGVCCLFSWLLLSSFSCWNSTDHLFPFNGPSKLSHASKSRYFLGYSGRMSDWLSSSHCGFWQKENQLGLENPSTLPWFWKQPPQPSEWEIWENVPTSPFK